MRLGIRGKLFLPNVMLMAALGFALLFYFLSRGAISRFEERGRHVLAESTNMESVRKGLLGYFERTIAFPQLQEQLAKLDAEEKASLGGEEFAKTLGKLHALRESNLRFEAEVEEMTEKSVGLSNRFIREMSAKLVAEVDAGARAGSGVSRLERLVIQGASVNSHGNHEIRHLFRKVMAKEIKGDVLLGYLDKAVQNASEDLKNLKGTPFEPLPAEAVKLNEAIKKIVIQYLEQVKSADEMAMGLLTSIGEAQTKNLANSQSLSSEMASSMQARNGLMVVILALLIAAAMGISLYHASDILARIRSLLGVARSVSRGALKEASAQPRSDDELGEFAVALEGSVRRIRELIAVLENFGQGNLSQVMSSMGSDDEMAGAVKATSGRLRELVSQARRSTQCVLGGSRQIAVATQQLSRGATEQAASLEEITSTVGEIGAQTRENAVQAVEAAVTAKTVREASASGVAEVALMDKAMAEISESAKSISKVIKAIDDIAFQTNLLALNAAVEAARAGRHGKGFSVVAEEVRSLSGQSAKAAKETAELIENALRNVRGGVERVGNTSDAFKKIEGHIEGLAEAVARIARTSEEQARGMAQISEALQQVSKVTLENTAASEETAASVQDLESQATSLDEALSRFKVGEGERGGADRFEETSPTFRARAA